MANSTRLGYQQSSPGLDREISATDTDTGPFCPQANISQTVDRGCQCTPVSKELKSDKSATTSIFLYCQLPVAIFRPAELLQCSKSFDVYGNASGILRSSFSLFLRIRTKKYGNGLKQEVSLFLNDFRNAT